MKISIQIISLLLVFLINGSLSAQQPTGREVMKKYKAQEKTNDSSVEIKMTLINSRGSQRERQITQITKTDENDNRKTLIRFISPADVKGTGFLSIEYSDREDDNWLYLPALRKTRRIAGSDKTDNFMGSEFTYEDLSSEDLNAFEYKLMGSDNVNGVDTWKVAAIAVDPKKVEETGYSKRELWIDKENYVVIQIKYYDKDGAYVKVLKSSDIKQVPGSDKWRAYKMEMDNKLNNKKTVLLLENYVINKGMEDKYFTKRYLERGR